MVHSGSTSPNGQIVNLSPPVIAYGGTSAASTSKSGNHCDQSFYDNSGPIRFAGVPDAITCLHHFLTTQIQERIALIRATVTYNITIGGGANMVLYVWVETFQSGGAISPFSVTCNGATMALLASQTYGANNFERLHLYRIIAPASGVNAISHNGFANAVEIHISCQFIFQCQSDYARWNARIPAAPLMGLRQSVIVP